MTVSEHKSILEMHKRTKGKGLSTVFDRYEDQQPQCSFGIRGICCQLCSHGPCRITRKASRGICGATADTLVARNLVRLASHGVAAYANHLKTVAKTLKATARGKTPFQIREREKLKKMAEIFGINAHRPIQKTALDVADFLISELERDSEEPSRMVEVFAPDSRKKIWRELRIFPGGPLHEMMDAMAKSMTSVDTDPLDLLLTALRLSISSVYVSQIGLEEIQDVLFGTPTPKELEFDLGTIDPDYVNIVTGTGHKPFVAVAMIEIAKSEEMRRLAKEAGAKGIKIYGQGETGQELLQRIPQGEVFAGYLGNWITQEFIVATGAIDLVLMDMNCSIPGLKDVADLYRTRLVPVSKLVRMEGVVEHLDYEPEKVAEQAKMLIMMAVENFKKRGKDVHIPGEKRVGTVGFSIEAVLHALGGKLSPLIEAIRKGQVKGIVGLISCTTCKTGHDQASVSVAKGLIKRDMLIICGGCGSSALELGGLTAPDAAEMAGENLRKLCKDLGIPPVLNFGTCTDTGRIVMAVTAISDALGADPSDLPVAVTAPEYLEQKAVIDALFSLAFGLFTHISPTPPVTGGTEVVKILTEELENITGGKVCIEKDPVKAAEAIQEHINAKRKALGFSV